MPEELIAGYVAYTTPAEVVAELAAAASDPILETVTLDGTFVTVSVTV